MRTLAQIQQSIRDFVLARNSTIRIIEGSIVGDVLTSVEAQVLQDEERLNDYIKKLQSLDGIETVLDDSTYLAELQRIWGLDSIADTEAQIRTDLEEQCANFGVTPSANQYASGIARFYRTTAPSSDLTIQLGTQVYAIISGTNVYFQTTSEVVMYVSQVDTYQAYDFDLGTIIWRIDVPIEAVIAGAAGNVAAGLIIYGSMPSGFTGVKNPIATTDGSDTETNASLIARARLAFVGRELATNPGLEAWALSQSGIDDALVVDCDDSLMVRDGGYGGMTDLYLMGQDILSTFNSYSGAQIVLVGSDSKIILLNQPATGVTQVFDETAAVVIPTSQWTFTLDTGDYKDSNRGQSYVLVLAAYGSIVGHSIRITHSYDAQPGRLQLLLASNDNKILDEDILVKAATQVIIDVGFNFTITTTSLTKATVRNNVITALQTYFDAKLLGDDVYQADLIDLAEEVAGVDHCDVPFTLLARRGSIGQSSAIVIGKNEYADYDATSFDTVAYY